VGQVYGQVGVGLPIIVSIIAILMGLNLLEALPYSFHHLGFRLDFKDLPEGVRSYLIGLTFGVVASPCSTPVLASLLAWITTHDLILGGFCCCPTQLATSPH
jgi:cytochrome c-type biogenesis protein